MLIFCRQRALPRCGVDCVDVCGVRLRGLSPEADLHIVEGELQDAYAELVQSLPRPLSGRSLVIWGNSA